MLRALLPISLIFPLLLCAQPAVVETQIEKVTVFLSGAQVHRKGQINLTAGKQTYLFKGISPKLLPQSIQVKLGDDNTTLLSVTHQLNHTEEQTKRKEIETLESKQKNLIENLNKEKALLAVYAQEEVMLSKNQDIKGQESGVKTTDLKEALDFHRQRLTELKMKTLGGNEKIQTLNTDLQKVNKQLVELNQKKDLSLSEILITVLSPKSQQIAVDLSYLVSEAKWFPTYDVRVKDIASPLSLAYKANVSQNSGEDWKEVRLALSSGNPQLGGEKPQLQTWLLGFTPRQTYPVDRMGSRNINDPTYKSVSDSVSIKSLQRVAATTPGVYRNELDEGYQLNLLGTRDASTGYLVDGAKVRGEPNTPMSALLKVDQNLLDEYSMTTFLFDIAEAYTIPSDGKNYMAEVKSYEIPAYYEYYCAPKLDKDAFLTANISKWNQYQFIEGETNLFFEGTYIGKGFLSLANVKDTLALSLGRDKSVIVGRELLKDFSQKQLIGNFRTQTLAYEISVRNTKKFPINLTLEDQVPVSSFKEITVERIENKEALVNEETGKLTWKMSVEGGKEKRVGFKYAVKSPKYSGVNVK